LKVGDTKKCRNRRHSKSDGLSLRERRDEADIEDFAAGEAAIADNFDVAFVLVIDSGAGD